MGRGPQRGVSSVQCPVSCPRMPCSALACPVFGNLSWIPPTFFSRFFLLRLQLRLSHTRISPSQTMALANRRAAPNCNVQKPRHREKREIREKMGPGPVLLRKCTRQKIDGKMLATFCCCSCCLVYLFIFYCSMWGRHSKSFVWQINTCSLSKLWGKKE